MSSGDEYVYSDEDFEEETSHSYKTDASKAIALTYEYESGSAGQIRLVPKWTATSMLGCTHERFSGGVRPEPLRSPPAARDILENRPNRKTRSAREGRLLRLSHPSFRDRVVRAVIYVLMVDGHRTVQTPERASPGECGNLETFYTKGIAHC